MEASDQPLADKNDVLDDGYKRADPACLKALYVWYILCLAVGASIVVCVAGWLADNVSVWAACMPSILFAAYFVYKMAKPIRWYNAFRYRVTSDSVDIVYGVLGAGHVVVPIERIQSVEFSDGPIMRRFGLADVSVRYIGSRETISFIRREEAENVAEHINAAVIRIVKEEE